MGFEFEYSNTGVQSTSTFRAAKKGFLCFLKIFFLPGFVQSNFDIVGELIYSIEDSITKEYNFIHNAFFFNVHGSISNIHVVQLCTDIRLIQYWRGIYKVQWTDNSPWNRYLYNLHPPRLATGTLCSWCQGALSAIMAQISIEYPKSKWIT